MADDDSWTTKTWLKSFGLERYLTSFLENGYETKKLCSKLKDEDLDEMKITDITHRSIIFNQSTMLRTGSDRLSSTTGPKTPDKCASPLIHNSTDSAELQNIGNYSSVFDDISVGRTALPIGKTSLMDKKKGSTFDRADKTKQKKPVRRIKSTNVKPGSAAHMTKLELKLLLRELVQRDGLVLNEPPYSNEDGSTNTCSLAERAETYAEELNIESLTVMDALEDVWRYKVNETSDFVIPAKVGKLPMSNPGAVSSTGSVVFQDHGTYSEPFDSRSSRPLPPPVHSKPPNVHHTSGSSPPGFPKPSTNSPTVTEQSGYLDPFDALDGGNPVITKTSPAIERKKPAISPKPGALRFGSTENSRLLRDELIRFGKTIPPESPSLSIHSSSSDEVPTFEKSPKVKKSWVPFRRSGKTPEIQKRKTNAKKRLSGSMEDINDRVGSYLNNRPTRQSLPPTEGMLKMQRSISTNPALLYQQGLVEDLKHSKKTFGGSHGSINRLNNIKADLNEVQKAGAPPPPSSNTKSRVKALTLAGCGSSELELSTLLEVYVEGSTSPMYFRKAQSTDMFDDEINAEIDGATEQNKQKKQSGVISRLFKRKDKKKKSMGEIQEDNSDDSEQKEDGEAGLSNSQSLPDIPKAIAEAKIHSEYTEIDDVLDRVKKTQTTPPKLPTRFRSHSQKTHTSSPSSSPQTSPPAHHKLMVKSDSASSSEIIQSLPSTGDDIIELSVPTPTEATYNEPWTHIPIMRSPTTKQNLVRKNVGNSPGSPKGSSSTMISPIKKRKLFDSGKKNSSKTLPRHLSDTDVLIPGPCPVPKPRTQRYSERSLTPEDNNSAVSPTRSIGEHPPIKPKSKFLSTESHSTREATPPRDRNEERSPHLHQQNSDTVIEKLKQTGITYEGNKAGYTPPATPTQNEEFKKMEVGTGRRSNENKDYSKNDISLAEVEEIPIKHKKSQSRKNSLKHHNRSTLELTLEPVLEDEGIDLTQVPYSNLKGEYTIPTALVFRYAQESHSSEEEVVKALDSIRRAQLIKNRRGHIPLKKNWKNFMDVNASSLEDFLVSIGLPQYYDTISEQGFAHVSDLKGTTNGRLNSLPLKESHRKQLCAFLKRL